jgi:hypothetical protein
MATRKVTCSGKYCAGEKVRRVEGKGSFKNWILWICDHCGQVAKMKKKSK